MPTGDILPLLIALFGLVAVGQLLRLTGAVPASAPDVLARIFTMRRVTWTFLSQHAQVQEYDGTKLVLGIATVGLTNTFRAGNHAELVRQALIDEIGVDVPVEGRPMTDGGGSGPGPGSGFGSSSGSSSGAPGGAPPSSRGPSGPPPTADWPEPDPDLPPDRTGRPTSPPSAPPRSARAAERPAARRPADNGHPPVDDVPPPDEEPEPPEPEPPLRRRPTGPPPPAAAPTAPGSVDDAVSEDDEDIATSGAHGRAVIEKVLGGQFLGEFED